MKIETGKIYAIIGPNGCGKTTFVNKLFYQHINKQIIYIQQNHFLNEHLNIKNNLKFHHYSFQNQQINTLLDLDHIQKLYPSQILLGQRQMVAIICALSHPYNEFIIFDETLSGLNQQHLKDFFQLCQKSVHDHHHTILIVTHQKEVIEHCDEIINIQDEIPTIELSQFHDKPRHHISFKNIFMFQEKHWIKHLILTILLSLCFLFLSLTAYYRSMIEQSINRNITKYMSSEVFIFNNTNIYHPYWGNYDIYYSSISSSQIEKLQNIDGLSSFQSFIPFCLQIKHDQDHYYYEPLYLIENNQKAKKEITILSEYSIHPYTSYSRMDESILYPTSHQDGIILSHAFCEQIGIDEQNLENIQIEMTVAVPISQKDAENPMQTSLLDENGEIIENKDIEGRDITYQEITMTFWIKGILDEDGPFISKGYAFGYLPQEIMQDIYEEVNIDYMPNAYFAKITDILQYPAIQKQVEQILPTLEFYCVYNLFSVPDITAHFIRTLSVISIIPLCLFLIITGYTILIQKQSRIRDYQQLLTSGYHIRMCFEWIYKKYIVDFCLFMMIYLGVFYVCQFILKQINYPLIHQNIYLLLIPLLLICVIPIGVDIYALHKKYATFME